MTSVPLSTARSRVARSQAELTDTVVNWCDLNSGSDHPAGLQAMADVLTSAFARLPAPVERAALPGTSVPALRLRVRPKAPVQVLLSGHYDTVYPPTHPFQRCTRVDQRILRGPGVADMKGGLVVMLAALEALEDTPSAARIGYEVILNPDEEIGTPYAADLIRAAASRHQLGLVFEPARPDGSLVRARKGIGRAEVRCHGRAAHAARAEQGRNAIAALAEYLVGAHALPAQLPGILVNIGEIQGGSPAINVVPDLATATLDLRVDRPGDDARIEARLHELGAPFRAREGLRLELEVAFSRPPKAVGPVEESVFAAYQAEAVELGLPALGWVDSGGGSDGNLMSAAGLPNLDGLGPVGDGLHSDREQIDVTTLITRAQLTLGVLHRLATGELVLPARRA